MCVEQQHERKHMPQSVQISKPAAQIVTYRLLMLHRAAGWSGVRRMADHMPRPLP
jgi:hypothetical protein